MLRTADSQVFAREIQTVYHAFGCRASEGRDCHHRDT
jgi:hypothetical protein